MSETDRLRSWSRRTLLAAGCTAGAFFGLILGILVHAVGSPLGGEPWTDFPGRFSLSVVSTGNVTADIFGSNPHNALRVLQSVGVLLPLFTGLLRFTTNNQSEVSERVNDYLLLGIVGLVLAGVFAAVAGTLTETTAILKLSLLSVLFTFTIIGFAAVVMFDELTDATADSEVGPSENETGDEEACEAETKLSGPEEIENDETASDGTETESYPENDRGERPNESAKAQSVGPEGDEG